MNTHTYPGRGYIPPSSIAMIAILATMFAAFATMTRAAESGPAVVADLRVTVSASASSVAVGDTVTFTVTVCNDGKSPAIAPAVSRAFPGATLVSSTPSVGIDCHTAQTFPPVNGLIQPGFGLRFTDTIRADTVGTLSYRAFTAGGFGPPDPSPKNNDVTVETTVLEPAPKGVFQAAGPNAASIQSAIDQFRAALGGANNGNASGPLAGGRREINWDGGGSTDTSVAGTPFDGFLNNRGGRFTTPGSGFVQAPPAGLSALFGNPTYANIFTAFSPARLFSPIGSNVTEAAFFVPGGQGIPAATRGFGVVFTDVDLPDGTDPGDQRVDRRSSTLVELIDAEGNVFFSAFAPSSPGDGGLSFFGVVLDTARIARVRITAGRVPGRDDDERRDMVMMDDFVYGEPQPLY